MKFMTILFIALVIGAMSSPLPIRATAVGGSGRDMGLGHMAQQCVATELSPCLPAVTLGGTPTVDCCGKLNEQKPCLCGYIKNPAYSMYITSPNAHKVFTACNVPYPSC
ncbi:hypothetical protein EUTSA_v10028232mg [Eutrema salsugineum]|uniref:Bifunctional inhibitor/plant lipid transfer protein/seed storage helical domain-containing protein n=2 Tax=Eutrema salsugineum TaxID=72664 RepID=V4L9Z6_EUTSA|nr:hypothetical protein EUTSA_v10028232mg [Eutrema salsugineum]